MKINKILAVAINDYDDPNLNQIQNCKSDIEKIISILTTKYTFDDVEFISEKSSTTRKALFNYLNTYFINCLPDENVLLIYAGHGHYNEHLNTAYWQPSDADPEDSSSWISISDILTFIKASKAFHIGLISDSCFSGAIFEPMKRGGGIDAFETKKSRLGLTSGGLEKVSDGQEGKSSPFADCLINYLTKNTSKELPFSALATNIILEFSETKKQTPRFGALNEVGHEGGSLIFKLKFTEREIEIIDDKNKFLKEKMEHLFIELSEKDIKAIESMKPITDKKNTAVKKQSYEEAAKYRDQEKEIEKEIYNRTETYIDSFLQSLKFTKEEILKSKKLDSKTEEYKKTLKEAEEKKEKRKDIIEKDIVTVEGEEVTIETLFQQFDDIFGHFLPTNPAQELFQNEKNEFIKFYKENVIKIYEHMYRITNISTSEFLKKKIDELREILVKIYNYEINLVMNGYRDELDEIIDFKEMDVNVLNWIKNR